MRRKYTLAGIAAALLLAVSLVCDSKYNLQVTKYTLSFASLPTQFEDFKIVHLTDLHGMSFGKDNSELIEAVKQEKPDLIAITGDMAGNHKELAAVSSLLEGIEGAAPIYFVNGNHEWASGCVTAEKGLMLEHKVSCLSNAYEPLYRDDGRIIICGAEDPNGRADMTKPDTLAERLRQDYPEDFVLWLAHRNDYVSKYPSLPVELIICGHAHGGIVRLPWLGGLLSTSHTLIAEYETGLYSGDSFVMEVSRGLGNSIPVPRLFNRPELVSITLTGA